MSCVETRASGHILEILVNRPEKLNALNVEIYHGLGDALAELENNPELRVAVLHAAGEHFTSGIQLDECAPYFESGEGLPLKEGQLDVFGLEGPERTKPVVIAVQGYCFTWGVEILLNAEVRVAAADTQFQMLEVRRGIFPCGGATLRLPQQMGWANAHRYLLTGDRWDAEEAYRTGMVQHLVPVGEQYEKAMQIAEVIATAAPLGVQGVMKSCRYALDHNKNQTVAQMWADLKPLMKSEDVQEGLQSFLERRPAVFAGH